MVIKMDDQWIREKKKSLDRLIRDKEIGYLDLRIFDLINTVNKIDSLFTTSSCSGRIAIIDSEWPWDKEETYTIFKSHEEISEDEIKRIMSITPKDTYWLMVRGPILHIVARDINSAIKLLRLGREAGFKHSGVMDSTTVGYLVELISSSQITMPLRSKKSYFVNLDALNELIIYSNGVLRDGWRRIDKLKEKISEW